MTPEGPKPDFAKGGGLIPAVAQDVLTGEVLMLAYMNEEALRATLETGYVHYWSRSKNRLWKKGEESGHVQRLHSLSLDCDGDALVVKVHQTGPACHTGNACCFFTHLHGTGETALGGLWATIEARRDAPAEGSYTAKLLGNENLRLKKVVEEAGEVLMAAKDHDAKALTYEAADVIYHLLVVLAAEGVHPRDVLAELERRRK
ncbi:MAG TPA: bifunctional phosphoribosyl-AMP cyclohydrolase/phosphoribosyl-ATP diphosphatase HisIE [Candidatus Thermoplasmatota archaeon]|nr:bifunctional phosphoribosyl-AMP cyclohydrolase/phosphoribosyl-ATP diphosphatase HisIE [Candidatus Thermoplasmatota archaeon]